VGRALAHRRELGQGGKPVVRKVIPLAVVFAVIVSSIVLIGSPWITRDFFEKNWVVTASLLVAFLAYAPTHLARGICSGSGRFVDYGIVMGFDGATRIIGCIALWLVGVEVVGAYAMVVAAAPLLGVAIVFSRGALRTDDGPPASWSEITPNLGWLLGGSVLAAALVNAAPIGVDVLADSGQAEAVTQFGNGVILARVPLFLFQAIQASLLPTGRTRRPERIPCRLSPPRAHRRRHRCARCRRFGCGWPESSRGRLRRRPRPTHPHAPRPRQCALHACSRHLAGRHRTARTQMGDGRLGSGNGDVRSRHVVVE
jgi:hypothetical protein